MGSWSESCGFSGIEIGEDERALVAFLGKPKYSEFNGETHYEFRTPLIRGTYNDYGYLRVDEDEGVLALFNHLTGLSLKNGDDFCGCDHAVSELDRYWIRQDVFDALPALTQEFAYVYQRETKGSVKVKNIGAAADIHIADLKKACVEIQAIRDKWMAVERAGDDTPEQRMEFALLLSERPITDVLSYRSGGIDWRQLFQKPPEGVTAEALIEAYRRYFLITFAASELRKKFVPSEKGGPQHSGEVASVQFAKSIIAIQKERKKRWDEL